MLTTSANGKCYVIPAVDLFVCQPACMAVINKFAKKKKKKKNERIWVKFAG